MRDTVKPTVIMDESKPNRIKGHTKIELTDVKTGEVEIIEHDNFVTDGVLSWIKNDGMSDNTYFLDSTDKTHDLSWRTLFGGIYLFDSAIPTTSKYAPASVKMVGNSYYNCANGGTPVELGSYNTAESYCNKDEIVLVYDWNTAQGNGTINSVCLGTLMGGRFGYGNKSGQKQSNSPVSYWNIWTWKNRREQNFSYRMYSDSSNQYQSNNMGILYNDMLYLAVCEYDYYSSNTLYRTEWRAHGIESESSSYRNVRIKIYKRPANYSVLDIFFKAEASNYVQAECWDNITEVSIPTANYFRYFRMAGMNYGPCIYWINKSSVSTTPTGSSESVTVLNVVTGELSNITFNNNSGVGIQFCQQCHLIDNHRIITYHETPVESGYCVFDYVQGTIIKKLTYEWSESYGSEPNKPHIYYIFNDLLWKYDKILNLYDYSEYVMNIENSSDVSSYYSFAYYPELDGLFWKYSYSYSSSSYSRVGLIKNPWRLMTINNLPEPIIKTPDKTMKVTYTLTRATT